MFKITNIMRIKNTKFKGFSLVELIVYMSILTLILVVITNIIFTVTKAGRKAVSLRHIFVAGETVMDRIISETRNATSTNTSLSVFNTSPGRLVLNGTNTSGANQQMDFYVTSGVLNLNINGVYSGPLTSSTTKISSLVFRQITSTTTVIRVELGITAGTGSSTASTTLYTSIGLKGI